MIATLIRVLLMTVVWGALRGSFGGGTLLLGAMFSGAILHLTRPLFNAEEDNVVTARRPMRRLWRSVVLLLVFLRELVLSALEVAGYVLQPSLSIRPAIVEYPLNVQTDREITVLANMISLTPGTLSLDVAPDRSAIYVHAISVSTPDGQDVIDDIKGSLEKHIHRALGPQT
jgi:multicomponent Na+:H+ antiporter subunit E